MNKIILVNNKFSHPNYSKEIEWWIFEVLEQKNNIITKARTLFYKYQHEDCFTKYNNLFKFDFHISPTHVLRVEDFIKTEIDLEKYITEHFEQFI